MKCVISGRQVLHIVENLDRGAVENWLVRMLANARNRGADVDWTFYCTLVEPGAIDAKARELGARVIHSPVPLGNKREFVRALRKELCTGRYAILHSHHDILSAIYFAAAYGTPIRRCIVHVHNADESVPSSSPFKQHLYRAFMRRVCLARASRIVGISKHTLDTFLAGRNRKEGRDFVVNYGIDSKPFEKQYSDRATFRHELGLPEHSRILLFAGRLVPEKNPLFAVEVLAAMQRMDRSVAGVFVGTGSLGDSVRKRAAVLGIESNFRYLGWRDNVPAIMCCCDWFILPHVEHPMEGFGIAVIEAQLAGLRMLLSTGIPDDSILSSAHCGRMRLSAGAEEWARTAMDLLKRPAPSPSAAIADLKQSPMDMDNALKALLALHT